MLRPLNERSVQRVMLAASSVETTTHREAAILGGAVSALLRTGTLDMRFIQHATHAALLWGQRTEKWMHAEYPQMDVGAIPDASYPTEGEVRVMVAKFRDKYDPGSPNAVMAA